MNKVIRLLLLLPVIGISTMTYAQSYEQSNTFATSLTSDWHQYNDLCSVIR